MGRLRNTTKNNYYGVWKNFNEFFIKLDAKPDTWEDRITLFAGYLVDCNKRSQTVKSYISAIRAVLKDDGVELNEDKFLLNSLIQACKFKNDRVRTRMPIRKGMLNVILKKTEETFASQPYLKCMYLALFATTYYGMFRVGEVTTGDHAVKAKDVHVGKNKNKMCFVLHTSKTHWKNQEPQIVKIAHTNITNTARKTDAKRFCPFNLLREYTAIRPCYVHDNEPFFIFSDHSPVQPIHFRKTLGNAIMDMGLDPTLYGTHALRGGRSVDLMAAGVDIDLIRRLGRWRSNAVYTYLRG